MAAAPGKGTQQAQDDKTLEKVQAAKSYLDNYYENMQKEMIERRQRLTHSILFYYFSFL